MAFGLSIVPLLLLVLSDALLKPSDVLLEPSDDSQLYWYCFRLFLFFLLGLFLSLVCGNKGVSCRRVLHQSGPSPRHRV